MNDDITNCPIPKQLRELGAASPGLTVGPDAEPERNRFREKGRRLRVKARRPPPKIKDDDLEKVHWRTDDGLDGMSIRSPKSDEGIHPGTTIRIYTDGKSIWWEGDVGSPKGG